MPTESEAKEARHRLILTALRRVRVTSQEQVVSLLAERGIEATQSSVSRDFRELGVTKVGGRYIAPPRAPQSGEIDFGEIAQFIRGIRPAGPYLTVVLTQVGTAQTVAFTIDHANWSEIAGTVAGDDTVFIATSGARAQQRLIRHVERLLAEARHA